MSFDIPAQLLDNLAEGEEVKRSLKTRSLLNIPEFTFLTNARARSEITMEQFLEMEKIFKN